VNGSAPRPQPPIRPSPLGDPADAGDGQYSDPTDDEMGDLGDKIGDAGDAAGDEVDYDDDPVNGGAGVDEEEDFGLGADEDVDGGDEYYAVTEGGELAPPPV